MLMYLCKGLTHIYFGYYNNSLGLHCWGYCWTLALQSLHYCHHSLQCFHRILLDLQILLDHRILDCYDLRSCYYCCPQILLGFPLTIFGIVQRVAVQYQKNFCQIIFEEDVDLYQTCGLLHLFIKSKFYFVHTFPTRRC